MTRHGRRYTQLPGRRARRTGAPSESRDQVLEEQAASSDVLAALQGETGEANKLNPDGKRGPATNGVRDMINSAFRDFPAQPGETAAARFRRIADFLRSPDGVKFRETEAANIQALQGKVQELYDTNPRNGFVPRSGAPTPGPDARPPEARPGAVEPPARPPGGPEAIPADETADQMRSRIERERARPQGVIPADESALDMGRRVAAEQPGSIPPAAGADFQIVDLSVGAPRQAAPPAVTQTVPPRAPAVPGRP